VGGNRQRARADGADLGPEQVEVYAPAPQRDPGNAVFAQIGAGGAGGGQVDLGLAVQPAQQPPDDRPEEPEAVVGGVAGDVGVVGGDQRQPGKPGGDHGDDAHHHRVDHMHDVGLEVAQVAADPGQREAPALAAVD